MRTLHVSHNGGNVIFTVREWEGIGSPDYYNITLNPEQSSILMGKIQASVDLANKHIKEEKEKRMKSLEQEIQDRIQELKKLKES